MKIRNCLKKLSNISSTKVEGDIALKVPEPLIEARRLICLINRHSSRSLSKDKLLSSLYSLMTFDIGVTTLSQ